MFDVVLVECVPAIIRLLTVVGVFCWQDVSGISGVQCDWPQP